MNQPLTIEIAGKHWLYTWAILAVGIVVFAMTSLSYFSIELIMLCGICCCIGSLPALFALFIIFKYIRNISASTSSKIKYALLGQFAICFLYGLFGIIIDGNTFFTIKNLQAISIITGVLFACNAIATFINLSSLKLYFDNEDSFFLFESSIDEVSEPYNKIELLQESIVAAEEENEQPILNNLSNKINPIMQNQTPNFIPAISISQHTKTVIKAVITGVLILVMLIPTAFIMSLVSEREQRQKDVVTEVSDKWAKAQTVTGPYLVVPYKETYITDDNKTVIKTKNIVLLPENLFTDGEIQTEERPRSIYKVLLYKSDITTKGNFKVKIPTDIIKENIIFKEAKLCIGINDFKGIEGPITIRFNGVDADLTPGLPTKEIDETGLSTSVDLNAGNIDSSLAFSYQIKLRGSEQLSFVPLSGNSHFTLHSTWPNPSFDGNTLPSDRSVSEKGFAATWNFNKANLPFSTFLKDFTLQKANFSFGVTMLQPADQYAKTMRSVKYAILIIGLTFSLFFIVELMQKKPVHPVQYVLVGLALVIFYTLLLSISEYIQFDYAYLISSLATVLLITLYAKSHFKNWKAASVFGTVLSGLYIFTFVLISLEDTSLLIGSIGLFIVLAIVMYASRKVNWYNTSTENSSFPTT